MGSVKPDEKVKKYDTRTQPAFHEANKSFFEKFCNCCIAQNEKNELTRQEVSFHSEGLTDSDLLLLQVRGRASATV